MMKNAFRFLGIFFALLLATARAAENKYDAFLEVFSPLLQALTTDNPSGQRAVAIDLRLTECTGVPEAWLNVPARFAFEYPDKALLAIRPRATGTAAPQPVSIVRNGQQVRLSPAPLFREWIAQLGELPPKVKKFKLDPIALPVTGKEVMMLPVLFQIEEAPEEEGQRVLEIQLAPEIARSAKIGEWHGKVWISGSKEPTRIEISRPGWKANFMVDSIRYGSSFPPEMWKGGKDALVLTAPEVRQLLDALEKRGQKAGLPEKIEIPRTQ